MNISNNVVNLPEIYKQLLEGESKNTSKVEISSPNVCTNWDSSSNSSDSIVVEKYSYYITFTVWTDFRGIAEEITI